jgi:hypothetical protein
MPLTKPARIGCKFCGVFTLPKRVREGRGQVGPYQET